MTRGSRTVSQKNAAPSLNDLNGSVSSGTSTIRTMYSSVNAIVRRKPGSAERRLARIVNGRSCCYFRPG